MSDDLEVIMDDDPLMPGPSAHPHGAEDAPMYYFFDRDPYTHRHRSRSMVDVYADTAPSSAAAVRGFGTNGGTAAGGLVNGTSNHAGSGAVNGHVRLTSAEV